jgi:hypothetical protein
MLEAARAQFGPQLARYLGGYPDFMLYRCLSLQEDPIYTSQGAESTMNKALRDKIRCAEPMAMVVRCIRKARAKFLKHQRAALNCEKPVPPRMEQILAVLLQRSANYEAVEVPGTMEMEFDVRSTVDPTKSYRVVMPTEAHIAPSCCAYSKMALGLPCFHGTASIRVKHGCMNLWKFIPRRFLTAAWQDQYRDVEFLVPAQSDVDAVMLAAKHSVLSGSYLLAPRALAPPRGRPVDNAGERVKDFLEKGPGGGSKKRSYTCGLCGKAGHDARSCPLKQGSPQGDDDEEGGGGDMSDSGDDDSGGGGGSDVDESDESDGSGDEGDIQGEPKRRR